jgi:hypothetical protein
MPPAKKPTRARAPRTSAAFQEPAALKRLTTSLDAAQDALVELRKDAGRDVGQGARDLYRDLRTFVSSARRDSGKLAKALQRDFEQAQKRVAGTPTTRSRTTATVSRQRQARTAAKRSRAS